VSTAPIPALAPNLAVEVLSAGNTTREMARKCREYFAAGVQLVWLVDPETRTIVVHTAPEDSVLLYAVDTLEGGMVLPGFALSVRAFFAELDRQGDS
jgi:Uma2 family endonuclease